MGRVIRGLRRPQLLDLFIDFFSYICQECLISCLLLEVGERFSTNKTKMCFENNLTALALKVMSYIFLIVNKSIQLKDRTQQGTSVCLSLVNIISLLDKKRGTSFNTRFVFSAAAL